MLAFDIAKDLKDHKNLSAREIIFGTKVIEFVRNNNGLEEEIKALSTIEERPIVLVKFIYDKLLLLSNEEWTRIIDLATHLKLFNNLELANVKSVKLTLFRNEKVREQALTQAYESLKKLKKFGILV